MKIGLIADNTPKFPSLPLMKLSAYHKSKGDTVELAQPFIHYDRVYISKTFNLNLKTVPQIDVTNIDAAEYICGGTGYEIELIDGKEVYVPKAWLSDLPYEIEHIYPDYSLYPELTKNTAYGFLTRGCSNNCPFCVVTQKEGCVSHKVADLSEWWDGQKNIKLLDANLLSCVDRSELLHQLVDSKASVDYTQGLDARFITEDIAKLVCETKIKMAHFAFDLMKNEKAIVKGLQTFKTISGKDDRQLKVYILVNFNTTFDEDLYRVKTVMGLGYRPDVRIYQKPTAPQFLKDLARWANNNLLYRTCSFEDYVPRADGKKISEIYGNIIR